ncbi:MAG: SGNH/GDSL hydrolase family protein [Terracidiphilus sp.]
MAGASSAQDPPSKTEKIEWTWEVRPAHADPQLPNVLLLGDSITRNYYPEVEKQLTGFANVYLMATSASIGDPRLLRQIADYSTAQPEHFNVVHFNNGMHGWDYSEAEYQEAFPAFLAELRTVAPKAAFVWATTTPVKADVEPGPTNARIEARNRIADSVVKSQGIRVDDQHSLMNTHSDLYQDSVHFDEQGAAIQGDQAAKVIRKVLAESRR